MKNTYLLLLLVLIFNAFAQDNSSDTLVVESKGYGATKAESVQDAIRNAAESSVGILISSQTMIDNYITVRDIITTSANAYVYRYEDKCTNYDKNTNVYETEIKAFVAKKLLKNNVNAKINENLSLDLSAIQKAKFEMEQAKNRATSAIMYQAAYLQKNFRNVFVPSIDSLVLEDKDIMNMTVKPVVYCSFKVNDYLKFKKEYMSLAKRSNDYAKKIYNTSLKINYTCNTGVRSSYLDDDGIHRFQINIDLVDSKKDLIPLLKKRDENFDNGYWDLKEFLKNKNDNLLNNGLLTRYRPEGYIIYDDELLPEDYKYFTLKKDCYKFKIDLCKLEMGKIEDIKFKIEYQAKLYSLPFEEKDGSLFLDNADKDLNTLEL